MAIHPSGGGGSSGGGTAAGDKYLVGDALTNDSIRMIATNGMFQLQKRVDGIWVTLIESAPAQTVISESVKTGVGSLHLGAVHSIGSAGENVIFKNENTATSWFPVWQGITPDGVTVTPPASRIYQAKIASQPVGATAASSGQIDYAFQTTFAVNTSVFAVKIVAAETYVGKGYWKATYISGKEVSTFAIDINSAPGTVIDIPFKYPLDARAGAIVNVEIKKADGTIFKVRASSTQPTQPWRELTVRLFSDSGLPVDYVVTSEYGAGAKALWNGIHVISNAAIPANTTFSWGTTGATWKPDLAGNTIVWRGAWAVSTAYATGDMVSDAATGTRLWIANVAHTSATSPNNLTGTDIGKWSQRVYGSPAVQMIPPKVFRFPSPGTSTWIPDPGMVYAIAEVQAGGGAAGSVVAGPGLGWVGACGSGGSYVKVMITKAQAGASQPITIGSGGVVSAIGGSGGDGGVSSVGSLAVAYGGKGGLSTSNVSVAVQGGAGVPLFPTVGAATLIELEHTQSMTEEIAQAPANGTGQLQVASGGNSRMGKGGIGPHGSAALWTSLTATASAPTAYGAGGGGTSGYGNSGVRMGQPGIGGIVIITEYFQ